MKAGLGSSDDCSHEHRQSGTCTERSQCWFLLRANGGRRRAAGRRGTGCFRMPTFRTSHRREFSGAFSEARLPEHIPKHICLLVDLALLLSSSMQRAGGAFGHCSDKQTSPSLPKGIGGHPQGPQGSLRWRHPHRRRDGGWLRNEPAGWEEGWREETSRDLKEDRNRNKYGRC